MNPDDGVLAAAIAEGKRRAAEMLGEATTAPDPVVLAMPPWDETVADARAQTPAARVVSPLAGSHLNLRALLDVPASEAPSVDATRPAVSGRSGTAVMEVRAEAPRESGPIAPASSGVRGTFSPTTPLPIAAPISSPQLASLDTSRRSPGSAPQMAESRPFSAPQPASFPPAAYASSPAPLAVPSARAVPVAPPALVDPFTVGRAVLVTWSNGQRYPATVLQLSPTHLLVAFGDGQRHWVERVFVSV